MSTLLAPLPDHDPVVVATDLTVPVYQAGRWLIAGDWLRYVVWVDAGRGGELAPRTALHLAGCRNRRKPSRPQPTTRARKPRPRDLPPTAREIQPRFQNREKPSARHARGTTLEELLEEW